MKPVGSSVVAIRFIRTLKNKIYNYITSISKNMYINKLDDIVHKYNNAYSTIKMKSVYVKSSKYIDFHEKNNKRFKIKVDDRVRISKCRKIFAKGYLPNWSEEVFVVIKVKNTVPWA